MIDLITGHMGSSKTLGQVAYAVDIFLKEYKGNWITNIPVNPVAIAEYMGLEGEEAEQLQNRIVSAPAELLEEWRQQKSYIWDWLEKQRLAGALVTIDEIHEIFPSRLSADIKQRAKTFFGYLRQRKVYRCKFLSQYPDKIHAVVKDEAERNFWLQNQGSERDPFLRIEMADWYEIRGSFSGQWRPCIHEIERIQILGKWKEKVARRYWVDPKYFPLYDSFAASRRFEEGEDEDDAALVPDLVHEFQKRSKLGLVVWFLRKNAGIILPRFFVLACIIGFFVWVSRDPQGTMGYFIKSMAQAGETEEHKKEIAAMKDKGKPLDPQEQRILDLESENKLLADELFELRERMKGFGQVVAITGKEVIFSDGQVYGIQEPILAGPYKGDKIKSINIRRRAVILESGETLWQTGN